VARGQAGDDELVLLAAEGDLVEEALFYGMASLSIQNGDGPGNEAVLGFGELQGQSLSNRSS